MKYLGHNIDEQGIHPLQNKIEEIQKFERPKNTKDLLSFLGAVNF